MKFKIFSGLTDATRHLLLLHLLLPAAIFTLILVVVFAAFITRPNAFLREAPARLAATLALAVLHASLTPSGTKCRRLAYPAALVATPL